MNTQIEVTQAHIDFGIPNDPMYCALAMAIDDATRGRFEAFVDADGSLILDPLPLPATDLKRFARRTTLPLPAPALGFSWRYDRGMPVVPLRFSLDIPGAAP